MSLTVRNDETQRLTRELADLTGETLTAAVTTAVRERLVRVRSARRRSGGPNGWSGSGAK